MNNQLNVKNKHCPCCGKYEFDEVGSYEICQICGWEDDPVQSSDPEYAGGANKECLNNFRKKWQDDNGLGTNID